MNIKVLSFSGSEIKHKFAGVDLFELTKQVCVAVKTNEGVLRYVMEPGFLTDMRSGSHAIDFIIPKFTENNLYNLAILCHDFAYTKMLDGSQPISKKLADELLYQMAIMSGELSAFKAKLMWQAVNLCGNSAYYADNSNDYSVKSAPYMKFTWSDK